MSAFPYLKCNLPKEIEDELPTVLHGLPILGCELGKCTGETVELRVYVEPERLHAETSLRRVLEEAGADDIGRNSRCLRRHPGG